MIMNEIPASIQTLLNSSAIFSLIAVALYVVYKRMRKAEDENRELLLEKANLKPILEDVKRIMAEVVNVETTREKSLEDKIKIITDKLDKILFEKR